MSQCQRCCLWVEKELGSHHAPGMGALYNVSMAVWNYLLFISRAELQGSDISDAENHKLPHKDIFPFVHRLWKAQNVTLAFSCKGDLKGCLLNPNSVVLAGAAVSVVPMDLQGRRKDLLGWQPSDRLPAFQCSALQTTDCLSHWLSLRTDFLVSSDAVMELFSMMLFFPIFLLHLSSKWFNECVFLC